jgi:hypothetical protein
MGLLVSLICTVDVHPIHSHRIVAITVGFGGLLLFLFVPETFWDRTPRPKSRRPTVKRSFSNLLHPLQHHKMESLPGNSAHRAEFDEVAIEKTMTARQHMLHEQNAHARFADASASEHADQTGEAESNDDVGPHESIASPGLNSNSRPPAPISATDGAADSTDATAPASAEDSAGPTRTKSKIRPTGLAIPMPPKPADTALADHPWDGRQLPAGFVQPTAPVISEPSDGHAVAHLHNLNSPYYLELEKKGGDYLSHHDLQAQEPKLESVPLDTDLEKYKSPSADASSPTSPRLMRYTTNLKQSPPNSWIQTLRPWNGRLSKANWFRVALRPFILYAYPSVLWSALVYSLSIGWLIVLSESISAIYKNRDTYNFTSLQAGLVYLSPFIGGVLGTAVAGRISDIIVRAMAKKNGGVYEPEFRLVMAIPVAIATAIGLMGFGWSAQERDNWIVPTIFFGVISFGCSLGSTTAITFCVDSYRQFAGEALVTLNFSKNIFHGLVFSLFFATWLEDDGPKKTFLAIGGIQVACMLLTIPMYICGKRARMWTVRKGFMENF